MSVSSIGIFALYRTSIGKKVTMAVTGVIWIGFVLAHMYGNLKVFTGPEHFNAYAEALRTLGAPFFAYSQALWIFRFVLAASLVMHMWAAWTLYLESVRARSTKYIQHATLQANWAALYIRYGAVVIGIFILLHLMHFTLGVPGIHPDFISNDPYHNLVVGFQSYGYLPAGLYLVAMLVLGFHLYHGAWSMFQTLGLNNQVYTKLLRGLAWIIAIGIAGGFAVVPLAVILGIVTA